MRRRALIAALAAVAAGAGASQTASAADFAWFGAAPQGTNVTAVPAVAKALSDAARHWGSLPCGGSIAVYVAPTDPNGGMWSAAGVCYIAVNADSWPLYAVQWQDLCVGIIHEVGHILGHPHDADPRSVMYGGDSVGDPIDARAAAPECFPRVVKPTPMLRRKGGSKRRPKYLTRRLAPRSVRLVNHVRRINP